jgi:hypothetical protein
MRKMFLNFPRQGRNTTPDQSWNIFNCLLLVTYTTLLIILWKCAKEKRHPSPYLFLFSQLLSVAYNFTAQYRVGINYWRISLCHYLSRKCRKIVKFVSITHCERNIWNGLIVATAISRKNVNQCWREMAASPTKCSWCVLEFALCNSFEAVPSAFRRQFGRRGHDMKLQTFLFQMVVTSCMSVQYLWRYGFAKYSDNLYAPCTYTKIHRYDYTYTH